MRVKVDKIRDKAIEIEEESPASAWDMDSADVTFINFIYLKCKFFRKGEEIIAQAKVATEREIICSRCLCQAHQSVDDNFEKSYPINELGEYLEINDDIREEILLNFPAKVLCKKDCKGICICCGVNLNQQECSNKDKKEVKL